MFTYFCSINNSYYLNKTLKLVQNHKKTNQLGLFSIWAMGVGLVISGDSYGFNYGIAKTGLIGFFIPVVVVSVMFFCLIKCNTELLLFFPKTNTPVFYLDTLLTTKKGLSEKLKKLILLVLEFFILTEFLFTCPAAAKSIADYLSVLQIGNLAQDHKTALVFIIFCLLNFMEFNTSKYVIIFLTVFAVSELLLFCLFALPGFSISHLVQLNQTSHIAFGQEGHFIKNLVTAIPYAIWVFLGIEGLNFYANEISADKNFNLRKTIKKVQRGYLFSYVTLLILILLVLVCGMATIQWNKEIFDQYVAENDIHPLPFILFKVYGENFSGVTAFTYLGLGGLIASFFTFLQATITQIKISFGFRKRFFPLLIVLCLGVTSIYLEVTSLLIELVVCSACFMYLSNAFVLVSFKLNPRISLPNFIEASEKHFFRWRLKKIQLFYPFFLILISLVTMYVFLRFSLNKELGYLAISTFGLFLITKYLSKNK